MIQDRLLITTMLKIVYWDGEQAIVLHEGDLGQGTAHYHGLTWDDQGTVYVSAVDDFRYVIRRFRWPTFEPLPHIEGELHEVHQIFWQDGLLYVTNTGKNRVDVWDGGKWTLKAWNRSPCDVDHINAIWGTGEKIYIAEHGQKTERGSMVRICSRGLDELWPVLVGPNIHNVYAQEGYVYNLTSPNPKSGPAGILWTDITDDDSRHRLKGFPEWGKVLLRGLARTQEHWYIGMSRWEEKRDKRMIGDAIIAQLDNSLQEVGNILMPDFGPVCDVRVVDALDLAHNGIVLS